LKINQINKALKRQKVIEDGSVITCSQVMGFPSLSMAPSATMMMFNLWPESLASLNFLQSLSGQLTSGGHSGIKTKSASETMAAT
jgi:hypothetical protein